MSVATAAPAAAAAAEPSADLAFNKILKEQRRDSAERGAVAPADIVMVQASEPGDEQRGEQCELQGVARSLQTPMQFESERRTVDPE